MERLPHYRNEDRYITRHEYPDHGDLDPCCVDLFWREDDPAPYAAEYTNDYADYSLYINFTFRGIHTQNPKLADYDGWHRLPEPIVMALAAHGLEVEAGINATRTKRLYEEAGINATRTKRLYEECW